jgi:hypothetical protein
MLHNSAGSIHPRLYRKAIEANLSKIAARQRIEECAEATAIIINSEETPTPRTVGATIDERIRKTQQDLEKHLQSLEQRLTNEKTNPHPSNDASPNHPPQPT